MERMGGGKKRDNYGYTLILSKKRKYWFVSHESMLEWRFALYRAHLHLNRPNFLSLILEGHALGGEGRGEEEQEGEGCTCNKILKIVFKDSLKFLPKSLDKLTKTLRNKAQFPQDCAECKDKNLLSVPLCTSCFSKKHPKEVFTNTYKYIQDNFGVQHLDSLLKKQVILEILRG